MIKKLKTPSKDRIFNMDPTGLAPASLLAKGRILLHKLQARVHVLHDNKKRKGPQVSPFSPQADLARRIGAIYPLQRCYQNIKPFVKQMIVDNQKTALPRDLVRKAPSSLCHGARTSFGSPMTLLIGKRVKIKPRVYIDPLKPFALKLKAGQDSSATSLYQNYNIKKPIFQLIYSLSTKQKL